MAESYSIVYMYYIFFILSPSNGHLDYFQVLAIVNSIALNTGMHVSFWTMVFSGYIPMSGIAGSYGTLFLVFLRNPNTVLHNGYIMPCSWIGKCSIFFQLLKTQF